MRLKCELNNKGYSLIEMAVSLVVVGMLAVVGASLYPKLTESSANESSQASRLLADRAILGFVFANGRLPCPASTTSGVENCAVEKGFLPYRSLGLSDQLLNQRDLPLHFAVFAKAAVGSSDMTLDALSDRYAPYLATDNNSVSTQPVAQSVVLNTGKANGMDLCHALQNSSAVVNDTANLHIGTGALLEQVAYVIHDLGLSDADGSGSISDGLNTLTTTDLGFNRPTDLKSSLNDDSVYIKSFNELWNDIGCDAVMAAAGHAHPNVGTASALMNQSMADYKVQVELARDVARADIAAAVAAIAGGAAATAGAAAAIPVAISESLNTAGVTAGYNVLAIAGTVAAAAAVVTASIGTVLAAGNLSEAEEMVTDAATRVGEINTLQASIQNNIKKADEYGLYQH